MALLLVYGRSLMHNPDKLCIFSKTSMDARGRINIEVLEDASELVRGNPDVIYPHSLVEINDQCYVVTHVPI